MVLRLYGGPVWVPEPSAPSRCFRLLRVELISVELGGVFLGVWEV